MRIAFSMVLTKTLPSPILPVLAALTIASTAAATMLSAKTISILIFGRKSTVYSLPAINLRVPFLTAKALDLRNSHALNAQAGEGLFDVFQLERLNDGLDLFHVVLRIAETDTNNQPRPVNRNVKKCFPFF